MYCCKPWTRSNQAMLQSLLLAIARITSARGDLAAEFLESCVEKLVHYELQQSQGRPKLWLGAQSLEKIVNAKKELLGDVIACEGPAATYGALSTFH